MQCTAGWQYARCGWVRFDFMRVGAFGRSDERRLDFVRRRQWVHKDHAAQLQMSAKVCKLPFARQHHA